MDEEEAEEEEDDEEEVVPRDERQEAGGECRRGAPLSSSLARWNGENEKANLAAR